MKRTSTRAIIIEDNKVLLFFRRKLVDGVINEYYSLPGGGIESNETKEKCLIRELNEEFSVDISIIKYLGKKEDDNTIQEYFSAKIIKGTPTLGGEELERNNPNNYYEIKRIDIKDTENINFRDKDMVKKCINIDN